MRCEKDAKGSPRDRGPDRKGLIFIKSILVLLLAICSLYGQDIAGTWTGALEIPGGQLTVVFNIAKTDNGYSSTLDSPDQDALGIPVDSTFYKKPELTIKVTSLDLVYVGTQVDDATLNGTLTQMGQSLELNMKKKTE